LGKRRFFSDETIMELNPTRREYVRRPSGEGFNRKYISTLKKFGGKKVMFWGFKKFSVERDLIVVENKLDSGKYLEFSHRKWFQYS